MQGRRTLLLRSPTLLAMRDTKTPRWETAVMFLSFLALWAWWLARQAQGRLAGGLTEHPLSLAWNGLLLVSLAVLVVVFVRRMSRVQTALRENLQQARSPLGVPPDRSHSGGNEKASRR